MLSIQCSCLALPIRTNQSIYHGMTNAAKPAANKSQGWISPNGQVDCIRNRLLYRRRIRHSHGTHCSDANFGLERQKRLVNVGDGQLAQIRTTSVAVNRAMANLVLDQRETVGPSRDFSLGQLAVAIKRFDVTYYHLPAGVALL